MILSSSPYLCSSLVTDGGGIINIVGVKCFMLILVMIMVNMLYDSMQKLSLVC